MLTDGGGVGRGMVFVTVGNVFPPLAAVLSMPLITRAVGVDGRGDVAAATAPFLLLSIGATIGMPEAMTYFAGRRGVPTVPVLRRALFTVVVAGVIATVGCIAAADLLSDGRAGLADLITIGAVAVTPALAVSVVRGCANGLQHWGRVAVEQVVSSLARLTATVALFITGQLTVLAVVLITVISPVIGALAYLGMDASGERSANESSRQHARLRPILSYGGTVWIGAIAGVLLFRLDQTILVPLASVAVLGVYAVAANISEVPLVINNAVRDVTFAAESSGQVEDRLASSARLSSFACGVVSVVIGASMPFWVGPLFGAGFREATWPTIVLLLGLWLGTPGSVAGAALSGRGRPGLRTTSLLIALVVNVSLLVALTPVWGAVGAASATTAGAAVAGWINVWLLCRLSTLRVRDFAGLRRADVRLVEDMLASRRSSIATPVEEVLNRP